MNKLELIDYFFHPKNITLVGISRNLMGPSGMILSNMIKGKYQGPLFLINKNIEPGKKILRRPVKKNLDEIDTDLDLVFVIVPSRVVPEVLEDCGKHNVKAAIIVSAGFGESALYDNEKVALQNEIVKIAIKNGFIFVGPNCNGVYSGAISLNAIFGPRVRNLPGNISYVTRGGTAGVYSMVQTRIRGIGVSKFINLGDSANLEIKDFIEYYGQDPETKVIGVYSEGGGGKDFIKSAKKVTERKPVVFFKSGDTVAGQRAAMSHVGAISTEFSGRIYQGVARQAGLIPVESIEELADVCTAFMITYVPKGKNLAIITPAGSLGVMATDACAREGINVPPLTPEILEKLNPMLPEYWSHNNPIDVTDSMNFNIFIKIIKIILQDPAFHGLLVLMGDIGDNQGKYMDFGLIEDDFGVFAEFIRGNVRKMHKYVERLKKPVFYLGPIDSNNGISQFLRDNKIIVLPEFRRIARLYSALVRWYEHSKRIELE